MCGVCVVCVCGRCVVGVCVCVCGGCVWCLCVWFLCEILNFVLSNDSDENKRKATKHYLIEIVSPDMNVMSV